LCAFVLSLLKCYCVIDGVDGGVRLADAIELALAAIAALRALAATLPAAVFRALAAHGLLTRDGGALRALVAADQATARYRLTPELVQLLDVVLAFVRASDAQLVAQCDVAALLTFVRVDVLAGFTAWRYAARADKWRVGGTALALLEAALSGGGGGAVVYDAAAADQRAPVASSKHKRVIIACVCVCVRYRFIAVLYYYFF
jgi:hypothetical protein